MNPQGIAQGSPGTPDPQVWLWPCTVSITRLLSWRLGTWAQHNIGGFDQHHLGKIRNMGYGSKSKTWGTTDFSLCLALTCINHPIIGVPNLDPYVLYCGFGPFFPPSFLFYGLPQLLAHVRDGVRTGNQKIYTCT